MDYQNYENYMRGILGYNNQNNNIYRNMYQPDEHMQQNNAEELNFLYPEIYKIVYPMVCKNCNQNLHRQITKELLESLVEDIYKNIEDDSKATSNVNMQRPVLKNGDVRNPNVKESENVGDTRQLNYLLKDFIRVLLIREFLKLRRQQFNPPPYQPFFNNQPPYMFENQMRYY